MYYKCGDIDLSEDLTQDVFVNVWDKRDEVQQDTVKSYLYTIANNMLLNKIRHNKVVMGFVEKHKTQQEEHSPHFNLVEKEFKQELERVIAEMPEKQREVFLMNKIEELTYKEIAERLELSVKAIEKRMNGALSYLSRTVQYGEDVSQMTIDPRNLAALPSLGELDIFRSLQLLPGIGGTDETSSTLSIRNSPSTHNLVLFDGFTIYRLDHFFGVFSAINADAVRDIQVYKGGFGAKYGGRISGVVDITGNTGNFNEPSFSLGVNLMSARASANLPIDGGRGALHFSARRAYTDIIRSGLFEKLYRNYRDQSTQVQNQNFNENNEDFLRPDFHFADFNLKASYQLSQRDVISFSAYNGRDDLKTDFDAPTFNQNNEIINVDILKEQAEWGNLGLGLLWSRNWNANFYSSLQFAKSSHFFNYAYQTQSRDRNGSISRDYSVFKINDVRDWNLSATWLCGSGRPFFQPEINLILDAQGNVTNYEINNTNKTVVRLPVYHRLDFSVARKFDNGYLQGEVGLSILNVYNRVNVQSRRLRDLDQIISENPNFNVSDGLYRDIALLDFTPSFFFNLSF